ncbi:hypothetical protein PILCRDRAFT_810237 [Piloderma croceum F 1598]|uniref:Uncharacterized protein n=1 Tax=Piloderma croceum (strain F 1598) TaxID=765440 RepID=A0A0C3G7L5_PILCF|nr:hypothetical protein PILCRDRAFT_810237 [Piloderma croceum F 1598]
MIDGMGHHAVPAADMSALLTSFINRNVKPSSKRKGKKHDLNIPIHRIRTPPSPASFMSPEIDEKIFASVHRPYAPHVEEEESYESYDSMFEETFPPSRDPAESPQLRLDIHSEPLTDWFAHGPFVAEVPKVLGGSYAGLNGSGSLNGSGRGAADTKSNRSREAFAFSSEEAVNLPDEIGNHQDNHITEEWRGQTVRKPAPAPIRIPNPAIHGPKVQLQRSAQTDLQGITATTDTTAQLPQDSPSSAENVSAISGTSLARALMANSFILSSDIHGLRYRSGLSTGGIRQDSATLPRGEYAFLNSPYWRDKRISGGDIILTPEAGRTSFLPPIPRMPSASSLRIKGSKSARSSAAASDTRHRRSGAEDSKRVSNSSLRTLRLSVPPPISPPLTKSSGTPAYDRPRISRIVEMPTPAPSTPGTPDLRTIKSPGQGDRSPGCSSPLVNRNVNSENTPSSECEIATPSPDPHNRPPQRHSHSDTSLSPDSGQSARCANVLDEYILMSYAESGQSDPSSMASESSASITAPAPYRSASKRTSKKRKNNKIAYTTNSLSIVNKGRIDWAQRRESDTRRHVSPQENSKVRLLPIGERPGSLLVPQTPLSPVSAPTSSSPLRLSHGVQMSSTPPSAGSITRFLSSLETPTDSPDVLDGMFAPISRRLFIRRHGGSTPDPINVVRGSADISHFNIVSPSGGSSQNNTPSTGSGHQTFPETPNAFSPIWTPNSAGKSPNALVVPALSASSHLSRSASLSGTMRASQSGVTQKVRLTRATTVTGDKPSSRLHTVTEVTESSRPSSLLTPASPTPSSRLSKQPSSEIISEHTLTTAARMKPLPVMPPITSMSSPLPQIQVQNADSQPSSVRSMSKPLPAISQPPHSPTLSSPSTSPASVRPASPVHTSFFSWTAQGSQTFPPFFGSSQPVSPTTASVTPGSTHPLFPREHPIQSTIEASTLPASRCPPDTEPGHSPRPSFIAPPPYQAVVDSQTNDYIPTSIASVKGNDTYSQRSNGLASALQNSSANKSTRLTPSSTGRAARPRPPLPIGPRKPTSGQTCSAASAFISSVNSSTRNKGTSGNRSSGGWRKLVAQCSSPKFQIPAPKFRGYTLEAAQWTFTSQQLQAIVSRAIKQSAEASSVRLLRLETLDTEMPAEMHRLEMQKMDFKNRYKFLARRRWNLLESLTTHLDGLEGSDSIAAFRILEDLTEVSLTLDQLVEKLHSVTEQLGGLKSLGDVHSASALAIALRKLNASFLKQAAENQTLRQLVSTMEAERDDAWKQAEDVAQEYDDLTDRYGEELQMSGTFKSPSSRRSSQVSAKRKSSVLMSKAGLRSSSLRRSQRSSGSSGHRGSMAIPAGYVPPVPPMPLQTSLGISTTDLPNRSSTAVSSSTPSSETRDMLRAQEELYHLLGISTGDTKRSDSRSRSVTGPIRHSRHLSTNIKSPNTRPVSDISTPGFSTPSM